MAPAARWCAVALLLAGPAQAAALTPEQALVDRFYRQLAALGPVQRISTDRVFALVRAAFDLQALARSTLRDPWPALSAAQRRRGTALTGRLVALGIAHGLRADRPRSLVLRGQRRVAGGVLVRSRVPASRGRTLTVQWLVVATPRGPRIADLVVEGASMAVTRRAEVAGLWRRAGRDPDAFLARLEARVRRIEAMGSGAR